MQTKLSSSFTGVSILVVNKMELVNVTFNYNCLKQFYDTINYIKN